MFCLLFLPFEQLVSPVTCCDDDADADFDWWLFDFLLFYS